jgi:hypothetical protein
MAGRTTPGAKQPVGGFMLAFVPSVPLGKTRAAFEEVQHASISSRGGGRWNRGGGGKGRVQSVETLSSTVARRRVEGDVGRCDRPECRKQHSSSPVQREYLDKEVLQPVPLRWPPAVGRRTERARLVEPIRGSSRRRRIREGGVRRKPGPMLSTIRLGPLAGSFSPLLDVVAELTDDAHALQGATDRRCGESVFRHQLSEEQTGRRVCDG